MDDYREKMEEHRVNIIKSLDLDRRYILSHLRSKFIFDEEDCELILTLASRQQKASKFFEEFLKALEIEHPHLFETLTGKESYSKCKVNETLLLKLSVILFFEGIEAILQHSSPNLNRFSLVLRTNTCGQQLNLSRNLSWMASRRYDFDSEILSNQLTALSNSHQKITYMNEKTLKEKALLQKINSEIKQDLEEKNERIRELEDENHKMKSSSDATTTTAFDDDDFKELLMETNEKGNIIIIVQDQLLTLNEELERQKKRNDELVKRNQAYMQQIRDLTIGYDFQRSRSLRLSMEVKRTRAMASKSEDTRSKRISCAVNLQVDEITEERNELQRELDEYQHVTAALNEKYDQLLQEMFQEKQEREKVLVDCISLKLDVETLHRDRKEKEHENSKLQRSLERCQEDLKNKREENDLYKAEKEYWFKEIERIHEEKNDILRLKNYLQSSLDEANKSFNQMSNRYDAKFESLCEELYQCKGDLEAVLLQLRNFEASSVKNRKPEENGHDVNWKATECKPKEESGEVENSDRDIDSKATECNPTHVAAGKKPSRRSDILKNAWRRLDECDVPNRIKSPYVGIKETGLVYKALSYQIRSSKVRHHKSKTLTVRGSNSYGAAIVLDENKRNKKQMLSEKEKLPPVRRPRAYAF